MSLPNAPPALRSTFDALLAKPGRRRRSRPWLPLLAIALLLLFIGGLLVSIVLEDRALRREALQRDLDSAAQQITARITAMTEALSPLALAGTDSEERSPRALAIARGVIDAKPEITRVQRTDATGALQWQTQPASASALATEPDQSIVLALAAYGGRGDPLFRLRPAQASAGATLLVALPVYRDDRFAGAVVAEVLLRDLLNNGLAPGLLERYRIALRDERGVLASTSPLATNDDATATALAPLPAGVQLTATAFRVPSALTRSGLGWVIGALAVAVVLALGALLYYIARQQRIDRALLAETALRRAMEDSLATGLRVLDPQGTIRYVNRAFCLMSGWDATDLLGRAPPFPYWPSDERDGHEEKLRQILAGDIDPAGYEVVIQRKDGSRFDARMYVSPLVDDRGRHIGWMTSMTDVTEQKRARNELAAAHVRFTTVLESLEAAVSVTAQGGNGQAALLFANREYGARFGEGADGHERLAAALRSPDAGEVIDERSGRWFDVRLREIRWVDGRLARLQIATDITLRRETDEIVRQQQEKVQFTARLMTMGEMASSLAHELNQPLTAITNYSEGTLARLKLGQLLPAELLAVLEKTSVQAQRAGRIIRRIREFVKRSEPRRRPTLAARVIEDAVGFADIDASKRGIAIVTQIDPALPALSIDPLLIEQVLLNLLKNAMDAMEHALVRRIEIHAGFAAVPGVAEIAVVDHGGGIPESHIASLFQPFFSTKSEGMGMGLNICRSIVEFHHGRLLVESNPTGGTIMRFTLPLAPADGADDNPPSVTHAAATLPRP